MPHYGRKRERDPSSESDMTAEAGKPDRRWTTSRVSPSRQRRHTPQLHVHPYTQSVAIRRQKSPRRFGTKMYIFNVALDATNEEVKDLFSSIGNLKEMELHYDHAGRFTGTATMEYEREGDAFAAAAQLHNVKLHGLALQIVPFSCV